MKVILMKQTLQHLTIEAQNNNIEAQELIKEFQLMDVIEKEKYLVLTDKLKMFKSKFKLKVAYYAQTSYTIYYSYSWFTFWNQMYEFIGIDTTFYKLNPVLGTHKEMEELATKFNSIEDVRSYLCTQERLYDEAVATHNRYNDRVIPYKSKLIKNN